MERSAAAHREAVEEAVRRRRTIESAAKKAGTEVEQVFSDYARMRATGIQAGDEEGEFKGKGEAAVIDDVSVGVSETSGTRRVTFDQAPIAAGDGDRGCTYIGDGGDTMEDALSPLHGDQSMGESPAVGAMTAMTGVVSVSALRLVALAPASAASARAATTALEDTQLHHQYHHHYQRQRPPPPQQPQQQQQARMPPPPLPPSREELIAASLASMSSDERTAARCKASKGWTGDFSGVFFNNARQLPCDAFPAWHEKPRQRSATPIYDGGAAVREASIDQSLARSAADFSKLEVQFIGPNAHELAFQVLHPRAAEALLTVESHAEKEGGSDANRNAISDGDNSSGGRGYMADWGGTNWKHHVQTVSGRSVMSAAAAALDPTDPAVAEAAKRVLAVQFIGPNSADLAYQALFPDQMPPRAAEEDGINANSFHSGSGEVDEKLRVHAGGLHHAETGSAAAVLSSFGACTLLEDVTGAASLETQFIGAKDLELTFRASPATPSGADTGVPGQAQMSMWMHRAYPNRSLHPIWQYLRCLAADLVPIVDHIACD